MTNTFPSLISLFNHIKFKLTTLTQSPEIEAQTIICYCMRFSKKEFLLNLHQKPDSEAVSQVLKILSERITEKPLAYILGEVEFMGATYKVKEGVLIPRPETELLVEDIIQFLYDNPEFQSGTLLECGFGTGIISIESIKAFPELTVLAWDINPVAVENAKENSPNMPIKWYQKDFFADYETWMPLLKGDMSTILVSNPPYIASSVLTQLDKSVRDYEPISALDGGHDGLKFYNRFFENLQNARKTMFFAEIGFDQSELLKEKCRKKFSKELTVKMDYQGKARVISVFIS